MKKRLIILSVLLISSIVSYFTFSSFIRETIYKPKNNNAKITTCTTNIRNLEMKLDSYGFPHICYLDSVDDGVGIFYLRWNGRNWKTLSGENHTSSTELASIKVAPEISYLNFDLDISNNPHFVWFDGKELITYAKQIKGNLSDDQHENVKVPINSGYDDSLEIKDVSFSLDKRGIPHIAWIQSGEIDNIYLIKKGNKFWDGVDGFMIDGLEPLKIRWSYYRGGSKFSDIEIHFDNSNTAYVFYAENGYPAYLKLSRKKDNFPVKFFETNDDTEFNDEMIYIITKLSCVIDKYNNPHVMSEIKYKFEPMLMHDLFLAVDTKWKILCPNPSSPTLKENDNQILNSFYSTKFRNDEIFEDEIDEISDIDVDTNGKTHVVWSTKGLGSARIPEIGYAKTNGERVVCFDGSKWDPKKVNVSKSKTLISINPKIELDEFDFPNICWIEKPKEARYQKGEKYRSSICFMKWNGEDWVTANQQ